MAIISLRYEICGTLPDDYTPLTIKVLAKGFEDEYLPLVEELLRKHQKPDNPITDQTFRSCLERTQRWLNTYLRRAERQYRITLPSDCLYMRFMFNDSKRVWGVVGRKNVEFYPTD